MYQREKDQGDQAYTFLFEPLGDDSETLYTRLQQRAVSRAHRWKTDPDELMQDLSLALIESVREDPSILEKPYWHILNKATWRVQDERKREWYRQKHIYGPSLDQPATDDPTGPTLRETILDDPHQAYLTATLRETPDATTDDLQDALTALDPDELRALMLQAIGDQPQKTIAHLMDCKPSQVKYILATAKACLRDDPALEPYRPEDHRTPRCDHDERTANGAKPVYCKHCQPGNGRPHIPQTCLVDPTLPACPPLDPCPTCPKPKTACLPCLPACQACQALPACPALPDQSIDQDRPRETRQVHQRQTDEHNPTATRVTALDRPEPDHDPQTLVMESFGLFWRLWKDHPPQPEPHRPDETHYRTDDVGFGWTMIRAHRPAHLQTHELETPDEGDLARWMYLDLMETAGLMDDFPHLLDPLPAHLRDPDPHLARDHMHATPPQVWEPKPTPRLWEYTANLDRLERLGDPHRETT